MRCFYMLLFVCLASSAEIVDRLAATVGSTVITELQIDEDLRVAALLNGKPVVRDMEARRAAADRLVEQQLIQHEIDLSHYPPPTDQEVSTFYAHIEQTLGGLESLRQSLGKYDVSEQTLRAHLSAQLATLRFIEVRFAPDISVSDVEIEAAYRREVTALHASAPGMQAPALDNNERGKLSQGLLAERTDAALNSWLAESRKQVNIVYIDSALQ
jgi:hypothetical protein